MERESLQPLPTSEVNHLTAATMTYMDHLGEVLPWLSARGINEVAANTFHLGYVAEPIPGHEMYQGMLAIPYRGTLPEGQAFHPTLSLRFRCVRPHDGACKDHGHPKYMTMKGDAARMFNVPALSEAGDEIHVAEGELDAIVLNQLGFPAVAMPGATQWSRRHAINLRGFDRVFIWGDPDEAGREMVAAIRRSVKHAIPVYLSHGDVTESYLKDAMSPIEAYARAAED